MASWFNNNRGRLRKLGNVGEDAHMAANVAAADNQSNVEVVKVEAMDEGTRVKALAKNPLAKALNTRAKSAFRVYWTAHKDAISAAFPGENIGVWTTKAKVDYQSLEPLEQDMWKARAASESVKPPDQCYRNQPGGPWLLFDLLWGLIGTGPKQLGPCAGELKYGYKDREGQLKQVQLCFTKDLNAVPFDKFEEGTPASEGARFLRWCHMVIVDEALPQRDLPYGVDGKVRLPEEAGEMPPQTLREKLKLYLEVKWEECGREEFNWDAVQETINDYVDTEWAPLLHAFFSQKGALAVYTLHDALVRAEASDNPFNFKSAAEEEDHTLVVHETPRHSRANSVNPGSRNVTPSGRRARPASPTPRYRSTTPTGSDIQSVPSRASSAAYAARDPFTGTLDEIAEEDEEEADVYVAPIHYGQASVPSGPEEVRRTSEQRANGVAEAAAGAHPGSGRSSEVGTPDESTKDEPKAGGKEAEPTSRGEPSAGATSGNGQAKSWQAESRGRGAPASPPSVDGIPTITPSGDGSAARACGENRNEGLHDKEDRGSATGGQAGAAPSTAATPDDKSQPGASDVRCARHERTTGETGGTMPSATAKHTAASEPEASSERARETAQPPSDPSAEDGEWARHAPPTDTGTIMPDTRRAETAPNEPLPDSREAEATAGAQPERKHTAASEPEASSERARETAQPPSDPSAEDGEWARHAPPTDTGTIMPDTRRAETAPNEPLPDSREAEATAGAQPERAAGEPGKAEAEAGGDGWNI
ncbi:hypothetical protein C8Q76DRAFT_696610 [Earliella scabrosa]|nr:hypothetical protein C8Q76DRAFT_696610 [Earliella scabrosa]